MKPLEPYSKICILILLSKQIQILIRRLNHIGVLFWYFFPERKGKLFIDEGAHTRAPHLLRTTVSLDFRFLTPLEAKNAETKAFAWPLNR